MKVTLSKQKNSYRIIIHRENQPRIDFFPGLKVNSELDGLEAEKLTSEIRLKLAQGTFSEEWLETQRKAVKGGKKKPKTPYEISQAYLDAKTNLKENTRRYYAGLFENLREMPKRIKPNKIVLWIDERSRGKQIGIRAVKALSSAYAWAEVEGIVESNPFPRIIQQYSQTKERKKESAIQIFSGEEVSLIAEKAFDEWSNSYSLFLSFWFSEGWRPSEILALTWSDIDSSRVISVNKNVSEIKGSHTVNKATKTNRTRRVRLHDETILPDQEESPYLFQENGKMLFYKSKFLPMWRELLKELGIEYRKPYCIRHTYITRKISEGVSPAVIAARLDNSPQTIERFYMDRSFLASQNV